jgi:protein-S-isoprenylcysteine O-methyltransferase Ste14
MNQNQVSKSKMSWMMAIRTLGALVVLPAIFFLPAWTWHYWQAWVYLAIIFLPMFGIVYYFLKKAPEFLMSRMKYSEKEPIQKLIINLSFIPLLGAFILPGFDRRYGWSQAPFWVVIAADALVLLGYALVFLVFRENHYASRIIEVTQGQKVIQSGPYALIRHPMYLGALLMYLFSPLALGSYLSVLPALLCIPVIVARIINEEKTLARDLDGYKEYMSQTRYRLIPGIW